MQEIEILKLLNLMLGTSIILLCLLIIVISGVITTYYLKSKVV